MMCVFALFQACRRLRAVRAAPALLLLVVLSPTLAQHQAGGHHGGQGWHGGSGGHGGAGAHGGPGGHGNPGWHPGWHGGDRHFDGDRHAWNGGHWHHGAHGGANGWWWIVGPAWYYYPWPVYPYPDPYWTPAPFVPGPELYRYWCPSFHAFYPDVEVCPGGWTLVPN